MKTDSGIAGQRIVASPRARRAMRQRRIDPRLIRGSGPGGRVLEADVLQAAAVGDKSALGARPVSPMRRAIARATSASAAIPQFHLRAELDASRLLDTRQQLLRPIQAQHGVRLSVTDFMLHAMGLALRDFPPANAIWLDDDVHALPEVNVGLLVSLDDGLLIPAIHRVDELHIVQLALERRRSVESARHGRIDSDALRGVATSLSNLGATRVDDFTAIVFPPQSTILTAGRIVERPFAVVGQLQARPTLRLTLTVDHRVLDGAPAARFLGRIVHYLEQPALAICDVSRG